MLRLVDITEQDTTHIRFETEEINDEDMIAYVMFDTSSGISTMQDYYSWRSTTTTTDTTDVYAIEIDNTTKYPKVSADISDYNIFDPALFKVMTWAEHEIIQMLLTRVDLIRRRFPNPGVTISDTDGVGQQGVLSFSGGWDKKFALEELRQMIEGTLIEINVHPPATPYYWAYNNTAADKLANPYQRNTGISGIPYEFVDLIVQGAMIRCLNAWGVLEIDISFSTSDSGLTITYDRVGKIASWMQNLLNEYKNQKDFIKMNFVNSYGVGVGTMPFGATALWGMMMNNVTGPTGMTPLSSMLGFGIRANSPM